MPEFHYAARNESGQRFAGTIEADDKTAALSMLTERYALVTRLEKKGKDSVIQPLFDRVKGEDVLNFSQTLAAMLEGGIPLKRALDSIYHDTENPYFRPVILDLSSQLGTGTSLAKAVEAHPKIFDKFYSNMVKAGEDSGELPQMLNRVATYIEKIEALKGTVKAALTYPLVVLGFAFLLVGVILTFGVPYLEELYAGLEIELPAATQVLVVIGGAMGNNLVVTFLVLVLLAYLTKVALQQPGVQYRLDSAKLHTPGIGGFFKVLYTARFARTLALLYASGVPVLDALKLTADSVGNRLVSETIEKTQQGIQSGDPLSDCLRANPYFLDAAVGMVAAGEESGRLDSMLSKVADFYEHKVNVKLESLTSTLEPLMMIFIGIMIGGIIVTLGLPFMTLASAF